MMKDKKTFTQFFLYLFVGGLATIVEWIFFSFFDSICNIHYAPSTALAFVISTVANWFFGRLILFKEPKQNIVKELVKIYSTSVIGLLMNLAIMFIAVEKIGLNEMISKIIATGIVFIWNFLVRKLVIYKI